ncbi:MAG: alpha-N-arabinofuranosidase [Clostridia bacterium]|nr:alpha-N-arabinofuranosidase [Clostridia bacterium]
MSITVSINPARRIGQRSPLLYGHFIEHFHRQIYDGIYQPGHPLSDEDGFRTDILDAMRKIKVPILRWPGGCFVSAYHWKDAVGPNRNPMFDKAWRVEDPNTFGTDEYVKLCRKLGCEPYICTNAGTGTAEEMSDWVEYCNLETEGKYAKWRIANGYDAPHNVKYWSIGNENYGHWEIGAKTTEEWGVLVRESAKMMRHVDPTAELSAAALSDPSWNLNLLKTCGEYIDWISIHEYWDMMPEVNAPSAYEQCMAFTDRIDHSVHEVRGMLAALKLDGRIKIAFDEWNLRSWHHPNVHTIRQGVGKDSYVTPRDKNDINSTYTMADAVFTACFLNAMHRHCDIVGMANFAPILNTRGCIYSHDKGIVLRSTYHVFDLYVNHLGDTVVDLWPQESLPTMTVTHKQGHSVTIDSLDLLATTFSDRSGMAVAAVNKDPDKPYTITLPLSGKTQIILRTINGESKDSYNDVNHNGVTTATTDLSTHEGSIEIALAPHSVNLIELNPCAC